MGDIFYCISFFMNIYYRGEMIYCYTVVKKNKEDKYHGKTN